jgi:hypothetical protein
MDPSTSQQLLLLVGFLIAVCLILIVLWLRYEYPKYKQLREGTAVPSSATALVFSKGAPKLPHNSERSDGNRGITQGYDSREGFLGARQDPAFFEPNVDAKAALDEAAAAYVPGYLGENDVDNPNAYEYRNRKSLGMPVLGPSKPPNSTGQRVEGVVSGPHSEKDLNNLLGK